MTDLGTLGGTDSRAVAINDRGQVIGTSSTASGRYHAFIWQDGVMTDLGVLPGKSNSKAAAINDRGQVVGDSDDRAFLWQHKRMTDLGAMPRAPRRRSMATGRWSASAAQANTRSSRSCGRTG